MTRLSTLPSRLGRLVFAGALCSITLLSGCGGKNEETIKTPAPSATGTADSKPTAPPPTTSQGAMKDDK
jgi:hypothetical protein